MQKPKFRARSERCRPAAVRLKRRIERLSGNAEGLVILSLCYVVPFRFLIRDRDQKFTASLDEVFRSSAIEVFRAPQANGVAERFVRTVRSECLDWLLILNDQHLERVLTVFADHYNGHRPHRALALTPPRPTRRPAAPKTECDEARVQRRDRLGGVVHEYVLAA